MNHFPTFIQPIVKNPSVDSSPRSGKTLRFFPAVFVVLIPTRQEFAPVSDLLWSSPVELAAFKAECRLEVMSFLEKNGKEINQENIRQAQKALYGLDALFSDESMDGLDNMGSMDSLDDIDPTDSLDDIESMDRPPKLTRGRFVFEEKNTSMGRLPR